MCVGLRVVCVVGGVGVGGACVGLYVVYRSVCGVCVGLCGVCVAGVWGGVYRSVCGV